jgi:antitoxin component YwqK of YwqJK toxin-antitoxin module
MLKLSCDSCGSNLVVFDNKEYTCEYCKSIYPLPKRDKRFIDIFLPLLKIRPSIFLSGVVVLVFNWYIIENYQVTLMQKALVVFGVLGDYTDRSYYPSGQLESEFKYDSNGVDGISTKYYKDGRVKEILPYKNGLKDGPCTEYYKNGKKHLEWDYKNNKIIGGRGYYSSGKKKYLFNYERGTREGISKEYYETGELKVEWLYKYNQLVTGTKSYYRDGKLKYEYIYKNGQRTDIKKLSK